MEFQVFINGIIAASIIALIAIGFTIIYGTVRFFHLAHGAVYMIGGYATYFFFNYIRVPFSLAILLSILLCGAVGALIEIAVYRPLRYRNAHGLAYLIASLGLLILIQGLVSLFFGEEIRTLIIDPEVEAGFEMFGAIITKEQVVITLASVILILLLLIFVKTPLGSQMKAFSDNRFLAEALGVDADRIVLITFIVGSMIAGAAGGLISLENPIYPSMGFSALLYGILACIVGGIGSVPGTIAGSILLGMIESTGVTYLPPEWKDTIALSVLLLVLLFRPTGLVGKKSF